MSVLQNMADDECLLCFVCGEKTSYAATQIKMSNGFGCEGYSLEFAKNLSLQKDDFGRRGLVNRLSTPPDTFEQIGIVWLCLFLNYCFCS